MAATVEAPSPPCSRLSPRLRRSLLRSRRWSTKLPLLNDFVGQSEKYLAIPLPPFDPNAYLAYTRTGDRAPMERNLHLREDQLVPLVLAECAE